MAEIAEHQAPTYDQAEQADLLPPYGCQGCGLRIDGADDYCSSCWVDILDWLGW